MVSGLHKSVQIFHSDSHFGKLKLVDLTVLTVLLKAQIAGESKTDSIATLAALHHPLFI